MQLTFLDLLQREEAIDNVNSHVERLRLESKLPMDVDDPLDEERSARVFHLGWNLNLLEVARADLKLHLFFAHVLIDVLGHLSHHLRIPDIQLIGEDHALTDGSAPLGESGLEGFSHRYSLTSLFLALG